MNTLAPATDMMIFCSKPFMIFYTHPDVKKEDFERYPLDPLPMGIPVRISNAGWTKLIVKPKLLPASIRIFFQRASVEVDG